MNRLITLIISIALVILTPSVGHALTWVSWGTINIAPDEVVPGGEIAIQFSFVLKGEVSAYYNWWRVNLDGSTTSPSPTSGTLLADGKYDYLGKPQPEETTITINTAAVIPEDTEPGEHIIQIWVSEGPGWNWLNHLYSPYEPVIQVGSPDVTTLIEQLVDQVAELNLQHGISNSLDSKLQNALDALSAENAGNRQDAINKMQAFINAVEAQSGNKIPEEAANDLIDTANYIISQL